LPERFLIPAVLAVQFSTNPLVHVAIWELGSSHPPLRLDERIFYSEKLSAGTKTIQVMLKENQNPMGRFVRLV
jgi:hypothetical protein